jgi:hypothetical protein
MPVIHNAITNLQLRLHKDAAAKGWVSERAVQAKFVTNSLNFRYHCDIAEGKAKTPSPKLARKLDYQLRALHATGWWYAARWRAKKIDAITRRALSLGHVQDLTDPETSTQWVRIYVLAYTIGFAVGKVMPGLDLTRSDLTQLSAVYYAPGYELNVRGFQDSYALICDLWGGPVIIETYPGLPQAVWIRPVEVVSQHLELGGDLPALDEISFGHSLLNKNKQITFTFKGKTVLENMLVVGMTRSGKSAFTQNTCMQLTRMKDQVEGISYIDGAFSPGMGALRDLGIRLADTADLVKSEIHYVQALSDERDRIMRENDWPVWRGKVYVVVVDENHKFFGHFPAKGSVEGSIVANWPTVLLKRGIMMISITPNFTEKEGPVIYWGAFEFKVMFHVEEAVTVQRMFHKDKASFKFHPLEMERGQCVMKRPGEMGLDYVMCHPPMVTGTPREAANQVVDE